MLDALDLEAGQVRPTLSEWGALPNTVRDAFPVVAEFRQWQQEREREKAEWAARAGKRR